MKSLKLLLCLCILAVFAIRSLAVPAGDPVLARVEIESFHLPLALPVHALLQDSDGQDYALVFATEAALNQTGTPWRLLARNLAPGDCLLITAMGAGAAAMPPLGMGEILHHDGLRWVLRAGMAEADPVAESGFALQQLTPEPIDWPVAKESPFEPTPFREDPARRALVSAMIATVQPTNLYSLVGRLSGVEPVITGGKPVVINTRHTTSGLPLSDALATVFARFEALGLNPAYHLWSTTKYTNRNVSATLPGGARSNEVILVTAHLDDMPTGPLAPGADDNATGCAGVLTAAGVLSQANFERTIRFVLFTGEEQGLLGSAAYATAARNASNNIVAVLNLDMIGWENTGPPVFQLRTRTVSNPAFSNDLAIAQVFTNVVAAYGLTAITPAIKADGLDRSDHASFWNRNYPAILASEDYDADFTPYYHTTNDTIGRLDMGYFTDAVRAAVATTAHLAQPTGSNTSVVLEIANSDWSTSSGIGGSALLARHLPSASDFGPDILDLPLTNASPNPYPRWLKLGTEPYGVELTIDSRPTQSESVFAVALAAVATTNLAVTCNNKLRFDFLSPPSPDRIYLARVQIDPGFTPSQPPFLCITNLRDVITGGGYIVLPGLAGATNQYGTCEIAARFLDTTPAAIPFSIASTAGSTLVFATKVQAGTRVRDEIEYATDPGSNWRNAASFESDAPPTHGVFETGWHSAQWPVDLNALPPSPQYFFRLKRTWLSY